jgi:hypothetical protein
MWGLGFDPRHHKRKDIKKVCNRLSAYSSHS